MKVRKILGFVCVSVLMPMYIGGGAGCKGSGPQGGQERTSPVKEDLDSEKQVFDESDEESNSTAEGIGDAKKGETVWIGILKANSKGSISAPSEYCIAHEGEEDKPYHEQTGHWYQGFEYRLGSTNLVGEPLNKLGKIPPGRIFLVMGNLKKDLTLHLKKKGECKLSQIPMVQMRSDWGSPECGGRPSISSMAKLRELSAISVRNLKPVEMVSSVHKNNMIVMTVSNPLKVELPELKVRVHYEKGPGKPRPEYKNLSLPPLAPGASATVKFDAGRHGGRRDYRHLYEVTIKGEFQAGETPVKVSISIPGHVIGKPKD